MRRTLEEWRQCGCCRLEEFLTAGDTVPAAFIDTIYGFAGRIEEDTLYIQDEHPTDVLGSEGLWHTFGRANKYLPFTYYGEFPAGETTNYAAEAAEKVFIISPFHSDNPEKSGFYHQLAVSACRRMYLRGMFPVAPHIYFPQFMKDDGMEREYGIETGHILMRACTEVMVYVIDGYMSEGMRSDIEYAVNQLGITPTMIHMTRGEAELFIETTGV